MEGQEEGAEPLFLQLMRLYACIGYLESPPGAFEDSHRSAAPEEEGGENEEGYEVVESEDIAALPSVSNVPPRKAARRRSSSSSASRGKHQLGSLDLGRGSSLVREYSVVFHQQTIGLNLRPAGGDGPLVVGGFVCNQDGSAGAAEKSGEIKQGDELAGVNAVRLISASFEDTRRLIAKSGRPVTLHFRSRVLDAP